MNSMWLQGYIFLAFRIHKVMQATYESPFVEAYYGPPAWRSQVEAEPALEAAELVRQVMRLANALPVQGFASNREVYLEKHIKAMETICRKLAGEAFSLKEEARYCLDILPTWTPERQFEQAHTLYETVLPETGSLAERLHAYRTVLAFPSDQTDTLTDLIKQAFAEARKRTSAFLELPQGEVIEIEYRPTWEHDAAAYYQGNYRTHIIMNVSATATYIPRLFDHKVCHEGYPGHHAEYVLKDQLLARKEGYIEQTIVLTLCPQSVLTEGIAMVAHEMIFAKGEAELWITEHVYRSLQKDVDATVLLRLRQASEMLQSVWDNAAILLDEGRSEQEVVQYFSTYMLLTEERASQMVTHLKHPVWRLYILTYTGSQNLMRPLLQGSAHRAVFRRFLTEQFVPTQLEKMEEI